MTYLTTGCTSNVETFRMRPSARWTSRALHEARPDLARRGALHEGSPGLGVTIGETRGKRSVPTGGTMDIRSLLTMDVESVCMQSVASARCTSRCAA